MSSGRIYAALAVAAAVSSPSSRATSSARADHEWRAPKARRAAAWARGPGRSSSSLVRRANASGVAAIVTCGVSSQRWAGRSLTTAGRPAARYSSVLSGKLASLNADCA